MVVGGAPAHQLCAPFNLEKRGSKSDMVSTVRKACVPHSAAFDYVISEQVERLDDLLNEKAGDAADFFAKNHITSGLRVLLQEGLARLAGKSGQALYELRQAMGGGKTHSMIALGLLARDPSLRSKHAADIPHADGFGAARVVAINGRNVSRDRYIWGDIITQLNQTELGTRFWRDGPIPPTEQEWAALIGSEPTLILLDEIPPYLDQAQTRALGGGTLANIAKYAIANLFSAALSLPRCCIVVSNLTGSYENASAAIHDLANEAARQARSLTPVDLATDKIYSILRKRLFASLPDEGTIQSVTDAYRATLSEAVLAAAIPSTARQLADEIPQTYPFHPSVKHVIALFKNNETFRQTRGLMQIASRLIMSVWRRPSDDVTLIGCQHLNLQIQEVRDDLNRIRDLQAAVAHDIFDSNQSVAERIDADLGGDYARQAATMLLTTSLSSSVDAVQGFTEDQLVEYLLAPNANVRELRDAFARLKHDAWYLHCNRSDAWYFSPAENLKKLIDDRARNAPQPRIEEDMRRRLRDAFKPRGRGLYDRVEALPRIEDIDLRSARACIVLEPQPQQPSQALREFYEAVSQKNNLCVVTGDGSNFANLEVVVRRAYGATMAHEQMAYNQPDKVREAEGLVAEAEQAVNSTIIGLFNKVIYPSVQGLTVAPLQLTPSGVKDRGEEEIAEALSTVAHRKFMRNLDDEADSLIKRAEDLLWASSDRRARWADIEERARTIPRWPWIEPRGLARLREKAKGQGRWRDSNDGWIEKGPFPKEKSTVSLSTEHYDDRTGEAQIHVRALHAGKSPVIYYGPGPDITAKTGARLTNDILPTDATSLFFIAVDPNDEHETGSAVPWKNRLTLTHEIQTLPDGRRRVKLAVRPDITKRTGGVLRWNIQGINPKDGAPFDGEIVITNAAETKVWVYAEHDGVEENKVFVIPAANAEGPALRYDEPALLNKKLQLAESSGAFGVLKTAKGRAATLTANKLQIGDGDKYVQLRFGSAVQVDPDKLEALISLARSALGDEIANVSLDILGIRFATGRDLEDFLKEHDVEAKPDEIEQ